MLNRDQAEAASEMLLADKRNAQRELANKIATQYRPFSAYLRYTISGVIGVALGVMHGSKHEGGPILWGLLGLAAGLAYGFWLSQARRR